MKKILVLSSAESESNVESNRIFCDEISTRLDGQATVEARHYNDLVLYINSDDMTVEFFDNGQTLTSYDLIYFKSYYRYSEIALAVVTYLQRNNVPYICHELDEAISFSKLTQYARLSLEQIPIPDTVFMATRQLTQLTAVQKIKNSVSFPCVMKAIDGKGGDLNFLITTSEQLAQLATEHSEVSFVIQKFIPNTHDLRVLVGNNSIKLIIKRERIDNSTHLNNTSQGATATLVELADIQQDVKNMTLKAAALFKRDIAGVDVMFNGDNGQAIILEVNASPQVATGAFQNEKLATYAEVFQELLGIDKIA